VAYIKALILENPVYTVNDLVKTTGFSKSTIVRAINKLIEENEIPVEIKTQEQIKDIVLEKKGKLICEWCNTKVYILHKHHFPIPKRHGGTDMVNICQNCHADFHKIEHSLDGFRHYKDKR
jgi:ABC-type phosphate transport system ATPase subunit